MQQEPPFDWNAFLAQKRHTLEELLAAEQLSRSWVTCACGVQCARIPRHSDGAPEDYNLRMLGVAFNDQILNLQRVFRNDVKLEGCICDLRATLAAIESRAEQLPCNSPFSTTNGSTSTDSTI